MATRIPVCSDNFNRANENPIGGNWTKLAWTVPYNMVRSMAVSGNMMVPMITQYQGVEWEGACWNANSFNGDQYCEIKYVQASSYAADFMPLVRLTNDANGNSYGFYMWSGGPTARIRKHVNGVVTEIATYTLGIVLNSVYSIEAEGTTIRAIVDGVVRFTATDSSIAGGTVGMSGPNSNLATPKGFDNFVAGNLVPPGGWLSRNYWWNQAHGNVRG